MKVRSIFVLAAGAALAFSACTPSASTAPSAAPSTAPSAAPSADASASAAPSTAVGEAATVSLQLQWAPQAQFAGYFAAQEQGYYAAENLTVNILPGGPTVIPQAVG